MHKLPRTSVKAVGASQGPGPNARSTGEALSEYLPLGRLACALGVGRKPLSLPESPVIASNPW
jgi:hypothetical protein